MIFDQNKLLILIPSKTGSSSLRSLFYRIGLEKEPKFRNLNFPHYDSPFSKISEYQDS
jgi:hypothetical protein